MIAARQIAFGKAAGAAKPYKARLEYLESTGTQYIDTGYVFEYGDEVGIKLTPTQTPTNTTYLFGSQVAWNTGLNVHYDPSVTTRNRGMRFVYGYFDSRLSDSTTWVNMTPEISFSQGTDYVCQGDSTARTINDGENTNTPTGTTTNPYSVILFGVRVGESDIRIPSTSQYAINERTHYFWAKRDGETLISLIPVLDNDLVPCMYDEVSGEFLYNQGTGEFIAGPEITEE